MIQPVTIDAHNPGPMTGSGNHTYLLDNGAGDATLIDAGTGDPRHLDALAAALRSAAATLVRVLVTHAHADHASGAPVLGRVHPRAAFLKFPWPDEDCRFEAPWTPIADGARFPVRGGDLVALHTPGHSPDHLAFLDETTRTIYSGDLVIAGGSVMIHTSRGGDLSAYLASLERLRQLAAERLLPAHGPPITEPERVLHGYITHRMRREQQVLDALAAGRRSVPAIADSIYDGFDPALMPAARENVRAHLDKLRREGRAIEQDGAWRL